MSGVRGAHIHINGVVQGVGFRPFVYGLATRLELAGWVRNTSAGVDIEVDGSAAQIEAFVKSLHDEAPPLAQIDSLVWDSTPPNGFTRFEIVHSEAISGAFQPISPDVSICPDCLRELFDPADRRYRYPFINCTNCGPRFTIITDIPYDRPTTTMAPFEMCPDCAAEYSDPLDRRFHAQPVACPVCGPHVWLERPGQGGDLPPGGALADFYFPSGERAVQEARRLLADGKIVAIKGLGGFHLACDATNPAAVTELRRRKLRVDKPFALMMAGVEIVERHCSLDEGERALLVSRERPIVLLWRRPESNIARENAPGQDTLGVMLPYTPLHYLLLDAAPGFPEALVMTSGNLSEEPIATSNDEARQRLSNLADAFLMHNRDIHMRCDDSVVRVFLDATSVSDERGAAIYPLRRSRGYAPFPVHLPWEVPPLLATGAELKNTFCITKGHYAFLSQHIGDMENYETLHSFEQGVMHFERLFRVAPQALAYDLHPNYLASRYVMQRAETSGLPVIGVQHHHAHVAACMAEHGLKGDRSLIGVAFDGTGYGEDGAIWGGEFMLADYYGYHRYAHLDYIPLPGGDKAIRQPWRLALAWLDRAGMEWSGDLPPLQYAQANLPSPDDYLSALHQQIATGLNAPPTSSMGRLFDAVSALVGVRATVNYEAQAAIEFEALADPEEDGAYSYALLTNQTGGHLTIDPIPLFRAVAADLRAGLPVPAISARFHNGVAKMVLQVCRQMRADYQVNEVALSGGVWQNMTLLEKTCNLLQHDEFTVYTHHKVPANDGGLALGQAAIAIHSLLFA